MHHRDELACGRAFQTERMACAETDAQAVQHGWEQGEARLGGGRDGVHGLQLLCCCTTTLFLLQEVMAYWWAHRGEILTL